MGSVNSLALWAYHVGRLIGFGTREALREKDAVGHCGKGKVGAA